MIKCAICNKGHVTVKCKCEKSFCLKHCLAEKHMCTFDYKTDFVENNTLVKDVNKNKFNVLQ